MTDHEAKELLEAHQVFMARFGWLIKKLDLYYDYADIEESLKIKVDIDGDSGDLFEGDAL